MARGLRIFFHSRPFLVATKEKKHVFRLEREATMLCALCSDHAKLSRLVEKNSKNSQAFFCPNRGTLSYLKWPSCLAWKFFSPEINTFFSNVWNLTFET